MSYLYLVSFNKEVIKISRILLFIKISEQLIFKKGGDQSPMLRVFLIKNLNNKIVAQEQ